MANSTVCQSKRKPIVEPRRAKPKTYRQAPTHWLKFYEDAVIGSEARTAVVQLKSDAYFAFVGFTKAFDFVKRDMLWYKLIKCGVSWELLNVIRSMFKHVKSKVKHEKKC